MRFLFLRTACVFAGAFVGCSTHAQTPAVQVLAPSSGPPSTLAAAVESAWQRTAVSAEARGLIRRADADRTAAEALWAAPPSLDAGHRTGRFQTSTGARETELGVVVPLWLPGQRSARLASSAADRAVAESNQASARLDVAGEVRTLLWEIARFRSEVAVLQDQAASLRSLADDVDRRVRAGDLARADALAARGEVLGAEAVISQAGLNLQAALSQWVVLTGTESIPSTGDADVEPKGAASIEEHPTLRLAAMQVESARRRLDLATASRRSPPEVIARFRQETGGRPESSINNVGFAVRIPLATADRNQPLLAAALSDLDIAESRERQRRAQIEAAVRTARAAVDAVEIQLETERRRAALLRERSDLVLASFRAGETSLPELLRASGAARQAEASLTRQQAAFGLARARLQQANGQLP